MTASDPESTPRPGTALRIASPAGVLGAAFALHALTASAPYGLPALLPFVKRELDAGYFEASLVSSAFLFGIVVGAPAAGSAADSYGVRRCVAAGLGLATLALAAVAVTPGLLAVCALLCLAGAGYSVLTPGTNKSMLAWFPPTRRATAVGLKQTGVSVGGIVAAAYVPVVSAALGWRASFHAVAACYAAAYALALLVALDGPSARARGGEPPSWRTTLGALVDDRATRLLCVDGFLRVGIQYAFLTYVIAYAIDHLHAPVAWGVALYVIAHAAGAVGRIGWGWLSDRVYAGRRRGPYIAIALIAAAGFLALGHLAPLGEVLLVASVVLLGATAAGFQGVGLSLLAESGGARAGAASGWVNAVSFLGAVTMVPLCGRLLDAGAGFAAVFALLATLCAASAVTIAALPAPATDPRPRHD